MGVEMIHVYILFLVEEIIHKKMKTLHYAQICIVYPNISIMFQKVNLSRQVLRQN